MIRGAELLCVEVKTSSLRSPSRSGEPTDERWSPGSRFRFASALRQARAARFVARELRWRGSVEVALFEVWLDGDGRGRGRLQRDRGVRR